MSTVKVDNIENIAGTKTVPTDTVVAGSAKAWVNFNGTGTVAIRNSFNVSSITDNGVGDYTINFTNAMPDANYAFFGCGENPSTTLNNITFTTMSTYPPTTTAYRALLIVGNHNANSAQDEARVSATFFSN